MFPYLYLLYQFITFFTAQSKNSSRSWGWVLESFGNLSLTQNPNKPNGECWNTMFFPFRFNVEQWNNEKKQHMENCWLFPVSTSGGGGFGVQCSWGLRGRVLTKMKLLCYKKDDVESLGMSFQFPIYFGCLSLPQHDASHQMGQGYSKFVRLFNWHLFVHIVVDVNSMFSRCICWIQRTYQRCAGNLSIGDILWHS